MCKGIIDSLGQLTSYLVYLCASKGYAWRVNPDVAATALDALGNPVRLEVYRTLIRAGRPGLSIGEVQARVGGVPRSTLAHHLSKLVTAGLVAQRKDGASVISHANYVTMEALVSFLTEECCADEAVSCAACESVA